MRSHEVSRENVPLTAFAKAAFAAVLILAPLSVPLRGAASSEPRLLKISEVAPTIVQDLRYATPNNFAGRVLYDSATCWLCEPAAQRLLRVQKRLESQGLGLKVWDCYRPISVQRKLWAIVPDPQYVADPATGSRHNRGASVDLTLVDKNGHELEMPTPFDEFSERAHRDFMNLPAAAIKNRALLENAMTAEGFVPLPSEWWHFDDPEWANFAIRDEPLGNPTLAADRTPSATSGASAPDLRNVNQLLVVTSDSWVAKTGRLRRFERADKTWKETGAGWEVSLGIHGMAWGLGKQGSEIVENGPIKKEGDLTAPAGVFPLGKAYGYADPPVTSWPYQRVDGTWLCVDDPASASYNSVFKTDASTKKDWNSAEQMKRSDELYTWVINIEQNFPERKAGCGSCIFLHVWRKPGSATEGCTAMPETQMRALLKWLKPAAHPHLIQMPQAMYEKVRSAWGLP